MRCRALFVALLALGVSQAAAACEGLRADAAWVRLPPPGAHYAAAYFELRNDGRSAVTVRAVSSPAFPHAMLHETRFVDGRAEMRHLDTLTVAPGDRFVAAPGGPHVMLGGADGALEEGSYVEIVLQCTGGTPLSVYAEVRRGPP